MRLQALCFTPQGEWRWDSSRPPQEVRDGHHVRKLYPKVIRLLLPDDGIYCLCGVEYKSDNHIFGIVTNLNKSTHTETVTFYELCP